MDFHCDELPSTSHSTPKKAQDNTQKAMHETSHRTKFNGMKDLFAEVVDPNFSEDGSFCEVPGQNISLVIQDIHRQTLAIVEEINLQRAEDIKLMDEFQEKMVEKVTKVCQEMKKQMCTVYERNTDEVQVKLQWLTKVLDNCDNLNSELQEAKQALASFEEEII